MTQLKIKESNQGCIYILGLINSAISDIKWLLFHYLTNCLCTVAPKISYFKRYSANNKPRYVILSFNILTHFLETTMNFRNHTLVFSLQCDHFFSRYYWIVLFSPLILLAKLFIGQILLLKKNKVYKFLKITNSHQNWSQKLLKTHLVSQKLIMTRKRKISYLARSAFWPCGDCRGNCTKNSVCCDSCNSWYHYIAARTCP